MHRIPDDDAYCFEDQFLGRHQGTLTNWQRLAIAVFVEAANCLRKDEWTKDHLKAKQWICNRNRGFEYWAGVLGADPDVLRETLMKGLIDPAAMEALKAKSHYFRRVQSQSGRQYKQGKEDAAA